MPGIIYSPNASSVGAVTGMKRAHPADAVPTYGRPHPKKQRLVAHQLHHTQPVQHIADPISTEIGDFGDNKDFFDQQLRRAIAIQCRTMGFESARPEALEKFRGLVDSCMASLAAQCARITSRVEPHS
jgi:transcription initiation factor TFIID subunit 8